MQVRRASEADAGRMSAVLREAFAEYAPLYTAAAFEATTPSPDRISARASEGPAWIAEDGSVALGTVSTACRPDGVYIRSMAVVPAARARGVGSALMRAVERFAVEAQAERMYLSTTPFLLDAIRLYERYGFRPTGEPPHELFGTPLVTMARGVARAGPR